MGHPVQDKRKKPWRSARKLLIDNQNWWFSVGRSHVLIQPPTSKKFYVDFSTLTGRSWNTLEIGLHKKTSDGMIKPGHVRAYIRGRNLIHYQERYP